MSCDFLVNPKPKNPYKKIVRVLNTSHCLKKTNDKLKKSKEKWGIGNQTFYGSSTFGQNGLLRLVYDIDP